MQRRIFCKGIQLFIWDTGGGEYALDRLTGNYKGLLIFALLMFLDHRLNLAVNGFCHIIATRIAQGFLQNGLKCLLLYFGRHWEWAVEYGIHKICMALCRIAGVVECIIDIGTAVIKRWEEEPKLGSGDKPIDPAIMELLLRHVVTQRRLAHLTGQMLHRM